MSVSLMFWKCRAIVILSVGGSPRRPAIRRGRRPRRPAIRRGRRPRRPAIRRGRCPRRPYGKTSAHTARYKIAEIQFSSEQYYFFEIVEK